jgi:hypothetical protein
MDAALALTRVNIEGTLVVVSAFVIFGGSTYLLASAVLGRQLGYLLTATSFFAFMLILSALWVFGAPGTPKYLGPKGDLAAWVALAEGPSVRSSSYPVFERYPSGPWSSAEEDKSLAGEVEAATLAFQEFLAEEATAELKAQGLEGELVAEDFAIENLRFAEVDGTNLAAAEAFATGGGPRVVVVGYKDQGDEPLPSYIFLIGSIIGFAAHLPFLDRAERKRKDILTGGEQAAWRGPA